MRKINRLGIRLFICGMLSVFLPASLQGIPKTTIQDTLFNADGSKVQGSVTLNWNGFTASDGTTLVTNSVKVKIVQGVLVVDLVPNENATPAGTTYKATYLFNNGIRSVEHWVVPESATPVTVSNVRIGQLPPAGSVISISQISGLTESRIIYCQSRQREDCFQKAVIKRGLRRIRRSALRARSSSSQ